MIYLNTAATTLQKPPCVAQAVAEALTGLASVGRGGHPADLAAARAVFGARQSVAALLGCPWPERVVFTANATQALNTALFGLFAPGDHVLATDWDHNSVLRPLYALARQGTVALDFVPADPLGRLRIEDFASRLRPNTRAIVCTHASNLTGNLLDLAPVAALAGAAGALLVVDAAQTAGALPVAMAAQGIDVLCFTGHKGLMGPQGTGGLCVAPGVAIRPLVMGGTGVRSYEETQPAEYPARLEAGTLNGHGLAGLRAAADFLRGIGTQTVHAHELALVRRFAAGVRAIPGAVLYGDFSGDRAPVAALNLPGLSSAEAADELAVRFDIATRAGAHCAPRMHRALGTEAAGAVRFSFGWYNTPAEVDAALNALDVLAKEARG